MAEPYQECNDPRHGILLSSDSSEAQRILIDLRSLRLKIIDAWEERGVILTRDEQKALKAEIAQTCSLLTDLVSSE